MSNTLMRTLALAGTLLVGLAAAPAEAAHGRHGHGGGHRGHGGFHHGFGHGGRHHGGWHGGRRFHAWRGPGRRVFVHGGWHRWGGPVPVYGPARIRRFAAYGGPGPGCSVRRSVGWAPGGWHKVVTVRTCLVP